MFFPSHLAEVEQCQGGALSSVLCTELTLLGRAPVPRGFLTDVTGVLRVPPCAPLLSIPQQIPTVCTLHLSCQHSSPCHAHLWQCPARSLRQARLQMLVWDGRRGCWVPRAGKGAACPSPAGMRRAAAGSCDRAALSQGGFSTPSWVGSQPSCLKPSRWACSSVAPGRAWLACRGTGVTSAQDRDPLQLPLPMEGRKRFAFFPWLLFFFEVFKPAIKL